MIHKQIPDTETGFLKERYIRENTGIIYDLMSHTENKHIRGLLVLTDFEKIFDSDSWSFIYKALEYLIITL